MATKTTPQRIPNSVKDELTLRPRRTLKIGVKDRTIPDDLAGQRVLYVAIRDKARLRWPKAFFHDRPLPLVLGVESALAHSLAERPEVISLFLCRWTKRSVYLAQTAMPNSMRHALDGTPIEAVDEKHRAYAVNILKKRIRRYGSLEAVLSHHHGDGTKAPRTSRTETNRAKRIGA